MKKPADPLASQDLGQGYTLVCQKSVKAADSCRAVVKDPNGAIIASGDPVPLARIEESKRRAIVRAKRAIHGISPLDPAMEDLRAEAMRELGILEDRCKF